MYEKPARSATSAGVTAQLMSASTPLMRASLAFLISVRPPCPRYENWMLLQSSRKIAPLKRRRLFAQLVFQPIS